MAEIASTLGSLAPVRSPAHGAILGAAAQLFGRVPYDDVSVEDILGLAEVSRGTFYKYFRGKDDVLAALYSGLSAELLRRLLAVAHGEQAPGAAIRFGIDTYLDFHLDHGRLVGVMVERGLREDSSLFAHRKKLRADLLVLLGAAFQGKTGEDAPPWLMTALLSAIEGVSLELTRAEVTPADLADAKKAMHRLVDSIL